jgi:hypothetical protein
VEVSFKQHIKLADVESAGFSFNSASIPIHRTYQQKLNLLLVTLLNTPVCDAESLAKYLRSELAKYGVVHDVRLCYWPDTPGYLMPRALALFDLDKSPDTPTRLPSFIHCPETGAIITLRWKDAPVACNYCKQIGHTVAECTIPLSHIPLLIKTDGHMLQ